ncbi:MAG: gamma carbonic anhydrase family protein [Spirochaetae bacterium HGW-Spirochaetae-1]|jgi:carbonic anhydrase/acetyltransferase-like protein (isoleucine patch superfamily)|nr:MAG: gamma carbonic anhydrase family protein [Spirochaetae bacterium HGW-Spirochaetae-1]
MPIYEINERRPTLGEGSWVAPTAEIIGDVRIGKNCYIGFGAILRGDYGTIIIGDESAVEEGVIIHARPLGKAEIGRAVTIGHMAMIHNATINDYAVIGMQCMISDFSEIGEWAIIAEQSLIKRNQKVPGYKVFAGAPAVEKGDVLERHTTEWGLAKKIYVDLTSQYRKGFRQIDGDY